MQISILKLPALKKGVLLRDLYNPCVSVMTGARMLHDFVAVHGPRWDVVGAYNTGSASRNLAVRVRYVRAVQKANMVGLQ